MPDGVRYSFLARDVARLTGLTMSQLSRWDREGFFAPSYGDDDGRSPNSRLYSFKDVVGLRTIGELRGRHGVSFQELRKVASELSRYTRTQWSDIKLWVWNRKVHFKEPETGASREVVGKQFVLFSLIDVEQQVIAEIDSMRRRRPGQLGQVERHRNVAHNEPVVAGTRIPLKAIIGFADAGFSTDQIIAEYPSLTHADVAVALSADGRKAA